MVNYAPFPAELKTPASGSTISLTDGKATFSWEGTDPDSNDTLTYTLYVDTVDGKQTQALRLVIYRTNRWMLNLMLLRRITGELKHRTEQMQVIL